MLTVLYTHSHTDGRVKHAGLQPAPQEQFGLSVLLRDTSTLNFSLLYPLSKADPDVYVYIGLFYTVCLYDLGHCTSCCSMSVNEIRRQRDQEYNAVLVSLPTRL